MADKKSEDKRAIVEFTEEELKLLKEMLDGVQIPGRSAPLVAGVMGKVKAAIEA